MAASVRGVQLVALSASDPNEIRMAFSKLDWTQTKALLVGDNPFFLTARDLLVELAARHAVPAIYQWRDVTAAGGLMSYGANLDEAYRIVGFNTGRILRGEKPAELPVQLPTKFDLVVNLNTAKALGLTIPETLLATADEVIQ